MANLRPLLFVVLFAASGCASYQPAEISTLQPTDQIRLELDQTELARLLAFANTSTRTVSGRFVNQMSDSVTIVVRTPASFMQVSVPHTLAKPHAAAAPQVYGWDHFHRKGASLRWRSTQSSQPSARGRPQDSLSQPGALWARVG